jgi:hypothetical protein
MEWKDASPKAVLRLIKAIGGDGWSIYPVSWYTDFGIPAELIEPLEQKLKSDFKHPKTTLFRDGEPVEELIGVYTLRVLIKIAENIGVHEDALNNAFAKTGRGFQAQELSEAIIDYLRQLPEIVVAEE